MEWELGGAAEGSSNANDALMMTVPLGLLVLFGILLLEFNSYRRVAVILSTLPLAAVGIIPGLLLGGQPFGFMSLLGAIALCGVVVNNAIVLLDRADARTREGLSRRAASCAMHAASAARAAQDAAEEAYRVRRAQFEAGAAVTTDVVEADLAVTRARLSHLHATLEVREAHAELEHATGGLD